MNKDILIQLMDEINRENIRFGTCEIKFTFHDGKMKFYEIMINRRINIGKGASVPANLSDANYD